MSSLNEKALYDKCVIRSGNDYFCFLCAFHGDATTNWGEHVNDPRHTGAMRQFHTFFVSNNATERINCKACNSSVDYPAFADHATWHRIVPWHEIDDKYKIFFENRILRVPSTGSYACFPCKVTFLDWSRALLHIGEAQHLEAISFEPPVHEGFNPHATTYEFLVAEGFEPWGANSVRCRRCNRPNVQVINVEDHVTEAPHIKAKETFAVGFQNAESLSSQYKPTEPVSNDKRTTESTSSHDKSSGQQQHNASNNDGAVASNTSETRSRPQVPAYARFRHGWSQPRNSSQQSQAKVNKQHPPRRNSSTSRKPLTFPVYECKDGLYCTVCDIQVRTEAAVHEKEESHLKTLETLGYSNIEPVDGWTYRCKCCNCKVPNLENVFRHIKGIKHRQNVNGSTNKQPQSRGKTISFKMNFSAPDARPNPGRFSAQANVGNNAIPFNVPAQAWPNFPSHLPMNHPMPGYRPPFNYPPPLLSALPIQPVTKPKDASGLDAEMTKSAWESLPKDYIVAQNSKDLFCRICDCVIYGHGNVDDHIEGKDHSTAVNEFCSNVSVRADNTYHCKRCNIDVPTRNDLYIHLNGHIAKKRSETPAGRKKDKSCPNGESSSGKEQISSQSEGSSGQKEEPLSLTAETSNRKAEITKVALHSGNEHIVALNRQDYCCKVCYLVLVHKDTKIDDHLASANHEDGLRLHAKTAYRENGNYYCTYCRLMIPNFANVPIHVNYAGHKHATTGAREANGTTLADLPSDWRELARSYIAANDDDSFYCRICNVAVFSKSEVADHLSAEIHNRNLKTYGCSEIHPINGKSFACNCCDYVIPDLDEIFVHLSDIRHLNNVQLARSKMAAKQTENIEKEKTRETATIVSRQAKTCEKEESSNDRAEQPSEDYERMIEMMMRCDAKEPEDIVTVSECNVFTHRDIRSHANVPSPASSIISLNEVGLRKQRTPKICKDTKSSAIHHEDFACVYDCSGRARYIEESSKLLLFDSESAFCLACKEKLVPLTVDLPMEHLRSAQHCSQFGIMIETDAMFADTPEQFSDLKLARDYLEEITDNEIRCHTCRIDLENAEDEIRDHIAKPTHSEMREVLRARARLLLDNNEIHRKPDWYNIHSYECVPCSTIMRSEVHFAQHLESSEHLKATNLETRPGRPIFIDFCNICYELWCGYPTSYGVHCQTPEHLKHTIIDNSTASKLPNPAKHYLLLPDRSFDRYEKLFEERTVKRLASESNVIRDLKQAIGLNLDVKQVWAFQTSPESGDQEEMVEFEVYINTEKSDYAVSAIIRELHLSLLKEPTIWRRDEIEKRFTMCHLPTGTRCVLLFDTRSALTVERLYQFVMLKYDIAAKLMGFLSPWLRMSELIGPQKFTVMDLFCYVILYLQSESQFPKLSDLIDYQNGPHLKLDADEINVEFRTNQVEQGRKLRQLLAGFFHYIAQFDFRRDVACPRLGRTIAKHEYTNNYADAKRSEFYSAACIEDPVNVETNLTAGVEKLYVKHYREYSAESHLILQKTSNQSS